MNIKTILILICTVVVIVAGYSLWGRDSIDPPTPKNDTIVVFGDSLVQGVGASEGHDFVSLMSAELGVPIINAGKNGDTTETALSRLGEVLAKDPGIVVLLLGGNDYLRKVPKETTFNNLGKIVTTLQGNDTIVILLGVRGGLLRDTYENDFRNFAKEHRLVYVPNVLEDILGHSELMFDQVHPNDAGYKIIANKVLPYLKRVR